MLIPAHNLVAQAKWRHWRDERAQRDPIGTLARAYRAGTVTTEELTPTEREEVCAWLVSHRRTDDAVP